MIAGVGTGAAVGSSNNMATAVGAGLIAGLGTMLLDANTKDNYYAVQTDIRISEKAASAYKVDTLQVSRQGDALTASVNNDTSNTKAYTTKLTVLANKVNMTVEEATPAIKEAIAKSLAGLF
jgi:hypothetical protein